MLFLPEGANIQNKSSKEPNPKKNLTKIKRNFREDERGLKQVSHKKLFKKLFLGVSRLGKSRDKSWKQFSSNFLSLFHYLSAHSRVSREPRCQRTKKCEENAFFQFRDWWVSREWVMKNSNTCFSTKKHV